MHAECERKRQRGEQSVTSGSSDTDDNGLLCDCGCDPDDPKVSNHL